MIDSPYTIIITLDKDNKAKGKFYKDDGHSYDYKQGKHLIAEILYEDGIL